ncbi:MAG: peptidoglycan DD-metalloendopeptidase family protein [Candidatus Brocadiales bacterium]|nr:peptidoglycan DD-metalloendopeptidase family protein [Candidatus Brocadiales bacterium]
MPVLLTDRMALPQRPYLGLLLFLSLITGCATQPQIPGPPTEKPLVKPKGLPEKQPPRGCITHKVRRGETLWKLSKAYNVSAQELTQMNGIKDPRHLEVGQELIIPGTHSTPLTSPTFASSKGFIWPTRGRILYNFGELRDGRKNTGIDIEAKPGQEVLAAKGGVVEVVSDNPYGWGKVIVIRHQGDLHTWYAHNSRILVGKGRWVKQGQVISEAGESGSVTQPELHFKIFYKDKPVNPLSYLP